MNCVGSQARASCPRRGRLEACAPRGKQHPGENGSRNPAPPSPPAGFRVKACPGLDPGPGMTGGRRQNVIPAKAGIQPPSPPPTGFRVKPGMTGGRRQNVIPTQEQPPGETTSFLRKQESSPSPPSAGFRVKACPGLDPGAGMTRGRQGEVSILKNALAHPGRALRRAERRSGGIMTRKKLCIVNL